MNYSFLGKSDLKVSEISFGCMSLQGSDKDNEKLIHHAMDQGINLFDTADLYDKGNNELTVGESPERPTVAGVYCNQSRQSVAGRWQRMGLESTKRVYFTGCR